MSVGQWTQEDESVGNGDNENIPTCSARVTSAFRGVTAWCMLLPPEVVTDTPVSGPESGKKSPLLPIRSSDREGSRSLLSATCHTQGEREWQGDDVSNDGFLLKPWCM